MWIDITLCKDEGMIYSDNNYEINFVEILSFLIIFGINIFKCEKVLFYVKMKGFV